MYVVLYEKTDLHDSIIIDYTLEDASEKIEKQRWSFLLSLRFALASGIMYCTLEVLFDLYFV